MALQSSKEHFAAQLEKIGIRGEAASLPSEFHETAFTSSSYWIKEHITVFDRQTELRSTLPKSVDIVVIGSGITGATVAHKISLQQPELSVALLEARGICSGATGRNGGHLGRPNAYHIRSLASMFGDQEAIRIREFSIRNKDDLYDCAAKAGWIEDVDLRYGGTIVVFHTEKERLAFEQDDAWCRAHGMEPQGEILDQTQTLQVVDINPDLAQHGAVLMKKSGTIYPRKFVEKLLQAAQSRMPKLSIHPYTPVLAVHQEPANEHETLYCVETANGDILCRAVFHATNGYSNRLLPVLRDPHTGVYGCKAHMLAVQPNIPPRNGTDPTMEQGFGYADFAHWILQRPSNGPFLYGLAFLERLGDYDDTTTIPDAEGKWEMLKFLELAWPQRFSQLKLEKDVVNDWTGIQGFTADSSSVVGRPNKDSPGEFCSVGHNGEGMTRCFLAANIATEAMLAQLAGRSWKAPEWFPHSYKRNLDIC